MRIDRDSLLKTLDELGQACSPENCTSLRQAVYQNYRLFRDLMDRGFTRPQICQFLCDNMGITVSPATLSNYMFEAKRNLGTAEVMQDRRRND